MKINKLRLLYGKEFWQELEELIKNSQERVFVISAYVNKDSYLWLQSLIPKNVFSLLLCREDSGYIPDCALTVSKNSLHGKLYLVDDAIIIGSQNLANFGKEGEYNIRLNFSEEMATAFLYQALLKIIENEDIASEPVDATFLEFFSDECPFCGNAPLPDPFTITSCPVYDYPGFVSEADCSALAGEEGGCKYCCPENKKPLGEIYACDNAGCGLGINSETLSLVYHAITPPTNEMKQKAREFLRLYNFIAQKRSDSSDIIKKLDLIGKVYKTSIQRDEFNFIDKF
jgi:hypothetical protein